MNMFEDSIVLQIARKKLPSDIRTHLTVTLFEVKLMHMKTDGTRSLEMKIHQVSRKTSSTIIHTKLLELHQKLADNGTRMHLNNVQTINEFKFQQQKATSTMRHASKFHLELTTVLSAQPSTKRKN